MWSRVVKFSFGCLAASLMFFFVGRMFLDSRLFALAFAASLTLFFYVACCWVLFCFASDHVLPGSDVSLAVFCQSCFFVHVLPGSVVSWTILGMLAGNMKLVLCMSARVFVCVLACLQFTRGTLMPSSRDSLFQAYLSFRSRKRLSSLTAEVVNSCAP